MNNQQFFKSFSFKKYVYDKNRHTDNCTHHGAEKNFIGQLIKGSARLVSSAGTVQLAEGEIVFIPKGYRYHSYWYTDEHAQLQWYSIGFSHFPTADPYSFLLQKVTPSAQGLATLKSITDDLEKSIINIGRLYCFLADIAPSLQIDTDPAALTVRKAIACMRAEPHADMETVAKSCGVSASTLYSAFRRCQGMSPNEMRQKLLCEKATELLTTTGLSVEEISSRLGFSSSSYFRKVLYKHTGKTPLKLRKESSF